MTWVCIPSICSPESEEASSEICSLGTLLSQSSKSKHIPEKFYCNDNLMAFYQSFPFGMTIAEGIEGKQSGLWREMVRIIGEIRPRFVFVENVPALLGRGISTVLGDLAAMGYDAKWGIVSAEDACWFDAYPSIDHVRERIWIIACNDTNEQKQTRNNTKNNNANKTQCERGQLPGGTHIKHTVIGGNDWWKTEPRLDRVADGVPNRLGQLRGYGNAQVPAVVRLAWQMLMK